jgi:L-aminopeptidase/D-esterase-like protein
VEVGSVGAGTGATVGKALGPAQGMKGGFGFASLTVPGGVTVAAAVAVNAFGDVRGLNGRPVAGCRAAPGSFELAGAERVLAALPPDTPHPWQGNTTLAVVMTDAILSKATALKVCQMAFGGLYRTLAPALSLYDGDLVVTLASGARPAHVNQVGVLAERAVAEAILTAVQEADGWGLLPAARDLPGVRGVRGIRGIRDGG